MSPQTTQAPLAGEAPSSRLCVGVVSGVHGIRGAVRIKSFTADPADIGAYGPLSDASGKRQVSLRVLGQQKGAVLAEINGITDRNAAEALKGLQLFIDRAQLPQVEEEDEFYHADLIGMAAVLEDGQPLGTVLGLHDFGAGTALELAGIDGQSLMVPFLKAVVTQIDLATRRMTIVPPAGLFEKPEPPASLVDQEAEAPKLEQPELEQPELEPTL